MKQHLFVITTIIIVVVEILTTSSSSFLITAATSITSSGPSLYRHNFPNVTTKLFYRFSNNLRNSSLELEWCRRGRKRPSSIKNSKNDNNNVNPLGALGTFIHSTLGTDSEITRLEEEDSRDFLPRLAAAESQRLSHVLQLSALDLVRSSFVHRGGSGRRSSTGALEGHARSALVLPNSKRLFHDVLLKDH